MHRGDIMTREAFLARLSTNDLLDDDIVATVNERRTSDTAQIVVYCEDMVRFLWFSLRDGGAKFRQSDPVLSRTCADDWERRLKTIIEGGEREYHSLVPSVSYPCLFCLAIF